MSLGNVALSVIECIDGANGKMNRDEIVTYVANQLVDYAFEAPTAHGYGPPSFWCEKHIDGGLYPVIQRMLAVAMVAQAEHDQEMWLRVAIGK